MTPAGVVRIIWAIAPTAELRDAMLGDFAEEYETRLGREGRARARCHAWREGLLSLGGAFYRNMPGRAELFTAILPAVLWGYVAAVCASTAATILLLPPMMRFVAVSYSTAWTISVGPMALFTAAMGGYEAARAGRGAPLWSALLLGLVLAAVSSRAIALVWFWPALMPLVTTFCVAGAVFQQAQSRRHECEIRAMRLATWQ